MKKLVLLILSVFVYMLQIDCNKTDEEIKEIPITTNSEEALNHFIKGRDLWENMHIPEAALILDSAVMKDSSFAMAYYYLAYSQNDVTKLIEYLNKAKSHVDKISEGEKLFILGINEELNNRYGEAREIYKKLVVLFPGDKRAHGQLAWHYYRGGEFQSAIDSYKKAFEIDSNFAPTYNMIGYCYSNLDNFNEAEIALKKYSELMPDEANPHDSYAEILMKQGKFDESIKEYQKALSIDPNFSVSFIGLGTDFVFKGNYEKGREQFQKLLDAPYDDGYRTIAYESLAYSYIFENKYHDAINELQKAYDLAKMNEDFTGMSGYISMIGDILLEYGKHDEARKKYLNALELIQNSRTAPEELKIEAKKTFLLDEAFVALKKSEIAVAKDKAEDYLKQTLKSNNPREIKVYHGLSGMIALYEKRYDNAVNELLQANQRNPRILFKIAEAYEDLGNKEKAKEFFLKTANFNEISTNYAFVRNKAFKKLEEYK